MCMQTGTVLGEVFARLKAALAVVAAADGVRFAESTDYGAVTSCPTNLGTAMRASVHLRLPALTRGGTDARVKAVARPLGLSVRGLGGEHTPIGADGTCDISPSARLCVTEARILQTLHDGVCALHQAETAATARL